MYNDIVGIYNQIFPLNQAFLAFIPRYLGKPGASVLDLGCGPGDYVDKFSRAGYRAVGIDTSSEMIKQAQAQLQGTYHQLSFTQISELGGRFDCIYCVGNSLSYLPAGLTAAFFRDVYRSLNDQGHFVIQVVNWDRFNLTKRSDFPVKALSDGRTFHRSYVPAEDSTVIFQTELRVGEQLQGSWSDTLHPKFIADLQAGLRDAGLAVAAGYGDYQDAPFDPQTSPATILVAQKRQPRKTTIPSG